ncbi:hypothetical protein PFISCL1PPCAC_13802, partial [Pristionchus fissidentatus]
YIGSVHFFEATKAAREQLVPIIRDKYERDAMNEHMIVGDYWVGGHYSARPLIGLAMFCSVLILAFAFQTAIPLVLVHLNAGLCLIFPVFG